MVPRGHVQTFARLEPSVRTTGLAAVFQVGDRSINTRLLYQKLAARAAFLGARVVTSTELVSFDERGAWLRTAGGDCELVKARAYILTAGYGLIELVKSTFGSNVHFRSFKSHLVDLPRATKHSVFHAEDGQLTLLHHGASSIAGMTADSTRTAAPSFNPVPEKVETIKAALARVIPGIDLSKARGRACIKVDAEPTDHGDGSELVQLNHVFGELQPNVIWALPGKMTAVPHLTNALIPAILAKLDATNSVALRPADAGATQSPR